jgi:deoxyribodipyrimidine photo-lyase
LTVSEARNSNFQLGDDYPKPIVVAPEWSRHFNKRPAQNAQAGRGNQRGIDFYFKGDAKKKGF